MGFADGDAATANVGTANVGTASAAVTHLRDAQSLRRSYTQGCRRARERPEELRGRNRLRGVCAALIVASDRRGVPDADLSRRTRQRRRHQPLQARGSDPQHGEGRLEPRQQLRGAVADMASRGTLPVGSVLNREDGAPEGSRGARGRRPRSDAGTLPLRLSRERLHGSHLPTAARPAVPALVG